MKAWQFTKTHEPLRFVDVADPTPGPSEVVIDVKAMGLCHTDVTILDDPGWMELVKSPCILGHECAGVIDSIGDEVEGFEVGERVGICPVDAETGASLGGVLDGAYAEKLLVPASMLVHLPDKVSFIEGAAATDAGMTSYHALFVVGKAQAGMKVAIVGMGGIGEFGAKIAIAKGCEVYVADPKPQAQELARSLGATQVFSDVEDMKSIAPELILDSAGFDVTTAHALTALAPGGTIVVVGMGILHSTISTWDLIMKQASIKGSMGGTKEDIEECYRLIASDAVKPTLHTISFDEIGNGLDQLRDGKVTGRLVAIR